MLPPFLGQAFAWALHAIAGTSVAAFIAYSGP
jgi:hypothetical protein